MSLQTHADVTPSCRLRSWPAARSPTGPSSRSPVSPDSQISGRVAPIRFTLTLLGYSVCIVFVQSVSTYGSPGGHAVE